MKYLKLFLLLAAAPFIASCSDDDDFNTAQCTLGFQSELLKTKESAGFFNVPITIEGLRNGNVNVTITTTPAEVNGAVEGEHYRITDKTLTMSLADTTQTTTLNVQVEAIDNPDINDDRSFTMTIAACDGGEVKTKEITVVLRDNDAAFYEKFHGKWTLAGVLETSSGSAHVEKAITISGALDESDPKYDKELTVSAPKFVNVGVDLELSWRMLYQFDAASKQGLLGIVCGEEVANYGGVYSWMWATATPDGYLSTDPLVTPWALGDNDAFPTTITFPEGSEIYLYGGQSSGPGVWAIFYPETMTKK